jgi:hypothetical protein
MALAEIQDILAGWPGWTPQFDLQYRDELSGQASGIIRVKDIGPERWVMAAVTRSLSAAEHRHWKARLHSLENGKGRFYGYDLAGCYPVLYPRGTWPTGSSFSGQTATVASLDAGDARVIGIANLPAGFQLKVGDYIGIPTRRALHQVMEDALADGSGATPQFEVRPHIRPGVAVDDVVCVKRASCVMMLAPGSVSAPADAVTGRGTVAFQALQVP